MTDEQRFKLVIANVGDVPMDHPMYAELLEMAEADVRSMEPVIDVMLEQARQEGRVEIANGARVFHSSTKNQAVN